MKSYSIFGSRLCFVLAAVVLMNSKLAVANESGETDPVTMYEIGMSYGQKNHSTNTQNFDMARYWLSRSASSQHLPAVHALGWMYLKGLGTETNMQKALEHFSRAAEAGLAESQYMLGVMYAQGWGTTKSSEKSLQWMRLAAEQGHVQAQSSLRNLFTFSESSISR